MTLAEIKERLNRERNFGSRFPARIIFTDNLDAYCELTNHLQGLCDCAVNVADFCRAPDTVPQFSRMNFAADKQVLLLSVGEYLRLCTKRELNPERCQFRAFWEAQQPKDSKCRVIMPVFSCRDIFDRIIGAVDERQEDYLWTLDAAPSDKIFDITVYAPNFSAAVAPDAANLSAWLRNWSDILQHKASCSIVTLQHANVEPVYGALTIKTIGSPFKYFLTLIHDGDKLNENFAGNDFWSQAATVAAQCSGRVTFREIVKAALNVNSFDFVTIAARWQTLTDFQKNLVWLWYQVYPAGDYFSYAYCQAETAADIPQKIRDELLSTTDRNDAWIGDRVAAMNALNFVTFDEKFFALLDKVPLPQTKLKLLTCRTHAEKTYAVKIVSGLLRDGAEVKAVAAMVRENYPDLAAYMLGGGRNDIVGDYMAWYRKCKLINRFCGDCPVTVPLEKFDARYKLIQRFAADDCFQFWIDGFGIEYAPLFLFKLSTYNISPAISCTALALLPTDIKYNRQWSEHALKWDKLDKLSHGGAPDDKSYYSCIVSQLDFFSDVAAKVSELLTQYKSVVITGDHGSSRMAALAFHDSKVAPIPAPKKSVVKNFGRYCELTDPAEKIFVPVDAVKVTSQIGGNVCLVMNTYRHFSARGNAAGGNTDDRDIVGEIHGGNTPEERLVPVIVVRRGDS